MHPFQYTPQHPRVIYKNPPIVERVVSFKGEVSPEAFYGKFDTWRSEVEKSFPEYDPLQEWSINVQEKDGVPLFENAEPVVHITHRFWKSNQQKKRLCSMRLLPDQFTINLHREGTDAHRYEDLKKEYEEWLPRWAEHFEVTKFSTVVLDYVNLLSPAITPHFVKDGRLRVGDMLKVFHNVPGKHVSLIPPYDCGAGLLFHVDAYCQYVGFVRLLAIPTSSGEPAMRLDLQLRLHTPTPSLNLHSALTEADILHTLLVDQFEFIFTDEAKESFGKI